MEGRKVDLSSTLDKTLNQAHSRIFGMQDLITTIHTCIVANREIIHVPKSKRAVVF